MPALIVSAYYHLDDVLVRNDVARVVSILGPASDHLLWPDTGSRPTLRLAFDDTQYSSGQLVAPTREHIEALIGFAREWGGRDTLLVHCQAASSRSPAAAMIAAAAIDRLDLLPVIAMARSYFRPHLGCLRLADAVLGLTPGLVKHDRQAKQASGQNRSQGSRKAADISDHTYEPEPLDWYVEEEWCVDLLFDAVEFEGHIHDPCCGRGTIPKVAQRRGFQTCGSDLVRRRHVASFDFAIADFDAAGPHPRRFRNVVFNPPFSYKRGIAARMIKRALSLADHRVAALVPSKFLASQGRYELFTNTPLEQVLILSTRPSMPPGSLLENGTIQPKGGKVDFCWMVWNHRHVGHASISFLKRRGTWFA